MDGLMEDKSVAVSEPTKQAEDIRARWAWVEPEVWTDRMLTALEEGIKGGRWYSLMDKVYSLENLRKAFGRVKANKGAPGVDHQTVGMMEEKLEEHLNKLSEELKTGTYRTQKIQRVMIPKDGSKEMRPLGIPTVRDRVVQTALRQVIEPIYEREFHGESYGFRPNRGCKDALRKVEALLRAGNTWVVDADLKSYFDTIPHAWLMERVGTKISDGRVLKLVEGYLKQGVMEQMRSWTPERGTPQGAVISPLLANIYLDPFDHGMGNKGYKMVRYADDFVLLCQSEEEAQRALEEAREWMTKAGLELHPEKTRIVDATQRGGFDFLGYHFERGYKWPRQKSMRKVKDVIRSKTKRTNGQAMAKIIANINRTMKGWFEYFKHSHKYTFSSLDGWIRMRLRSILRKRQGRKGCGRNREAHQRWTNAYFEGYGLFSLTKAHMLKCQSSRR